MESQFELRLAKDVKQLHNFVNRRLVESDNTQTDHARKTRRLKSDVVKCDNVQTVTESHIATAKQTNEITLTCNFSVDNQTGAKTLKRTEDTSDSINSTRPYSVPEPSKMVTRSRSEAISEKSSSKKMITRSKAISLSSSPNPKSLNIPNSETQSKEKTVVSREMENEKNSKEDPRHVHLSLKRRSPRFESRSSEKCLGIKQTKSKAKAELEIDKSPCKRSLSKTSSETSDSTNTHKKSKTSFDDRFHSSIDKSIESHNVVKTICQEDDFNADDCDDLNYIPDNDSPSSQESNLNSNISSVSKSQTSSVVEIPQENNLNGSISSVRMNKSVLSENANLMKDTLTCSSENPVTMGVKYSSKSEEKSQSSSVLKIPQDNLKNSLKPNRLEEFIKFALEQGKAKPPDGAVQDIQDKTHFQPKLIRNNTIQDKGNQKLIHIAQNVVNNPNVSNVQRLNTLPDANQIYSEPKFVVGNSQFREKNTKNLIHDTPLVSNPVLNVQGKNLSIKSDISKIVFVVKKDNPSLLIGSQKSVPAKESLLLLPVTQPTSSKPEGSSNAESLTVPNYSKVTNDSLSKSIVPKQFFLERYESRKKQLSQSKVKHHPLTKKMIKRNAILDKLKEKLHGTSQTDSLQPDIAPSLHEISQYYQCAECNSIFSDYQLLLDHLKLHGKYPKPKDTAAVDSSFKKPSIGKVPSSSSAVSAQTIVHQITKRSFGTSISKLNNPNAKKILTKLDAPFTTTTTISETDASKDMTVLENPNALIAKFTTHSTDTENSETDNSNATGTEISSSTKYPEVLIDAIRKDPNISQYYECVKCDAIIIDYQALLDHLKSHGKSKPKGTKTVDSSSKKPMNNKSPKLLKYKDPVQSGPYRRQYYRKSFECKHCLKVCYSYASFTFHYQEHVVDIINGTTTSDKTPQSVFNNTETSAASSAGEVAHDTVVEISGCELAQDTRAEVVDAAANFEKSYSGMDSTASFDGKISTNHVAQSTPSNTQPKEVFDTPECTVNADNENKTAHNTTSKSFIEPGQASSDDTNITNQAAQFTPSKTQPKEVFNTAECIVNADYKTKTVNELLSEHGPRPFKCKICLKSLKHSKQFHKHLNFHLRKSGHASEIAEIQYGADYKSQLIQCEICGKSVKGRRNLKSHQKSHSKTYNCEICGENFPEYSDLKKHTVDCKHNLVETFRCDICDYSFTTSKYKGPDLLEKHKYRKHDIKSHQCHICGNKYTSYRSLLSHLRNLHELEKTLQCPHCHKKFPTKSILNVHIRHHKKEWKHKCSICGKAYQLQSQLTVHMRSHTGEKPYKCKYCGRGFIKKAYLKGHEVTHSDDKPFVCDICGHSVKTKEALRLHVFKHNNPKPERIQCDYCAKDFSCRGTFIQHMQRFHKAYVHLYQTNPNYYRTTLPVIDEVTVQTSDVNEQTTEVTVQTSEVTVQPSAVNEVIPLQIENAIDFLDYHDYL